MTTSTPADSLSKLIRGRRSVRDFLPTPIPEALLHEVLADASWAPSWCNTQPYRVAVACADVRNRLSSELCALFDLAMAAQNGGLLAKLKLLMTRRGLPDGDFSTQFTYPVGLQPRRRAAGAGLYELLGVGRQDLAARNREMRRNFEFFGAPTAIFLFAHKGLHEFSILDTGIFLNALMLSAHAHGLSTCAQGALATWASPVRAEFNVPELYQLICGVSIGYASASAVNNFNPGRIHVEEILLGAN